MILMLGSAMSIDGRETISYAATATGSYTVDYTMNDWGAGATVSVTIKNTDSAAINDWTLAWDFTGNQKVTNMWNATYTQSGTTVTAKNTAYNSNIPSNGSVSFG